MNEDYLRYLTTFDGYQSPNLDFMGLYPNVMRSFDYDDFFIPVRKSVKKSFIKQELKPMSFLPEERIFSINIEPLDLNDEDIQYLMQRLQESLMIPRRYYDVNNPIDYFDEYH